MGIMIVLFIVIFAVGALFLFGGLIWGVTSAKMEQAQKSFQIQSREPKNRVQDQLVSEEIGKALFDKHQEIIRNFLDITERKVAALDDYGDEKWEILPIETITCLKKISLAEKIQLDWPGYLRKFKSGKPVTGELPDEYEWLRIKLTAHFKNHHRRQRYKSPKRVNLSSLSGVQFEVWLAKTLQGKGFEIKGTPATGDQGADLIAKRGSRRIIIQAKRYRGKVGNKAVQEVISAVHYYDGTEGWVITNSSFTPAAKALARKSNVKLIDGDALNHIKDYLEQD